MPSLRIGGLARLSTCDWPGELVATLFCQGCGWDCAYCHNPHLIPARSHMELTWEAVLTFLEERRGLLDGVVFSGGEPLLQPALAEAISIARDLGYRIALHTNGQLPERLAAVLPQLDWVGLDVKAPFADYESVTGIAGSGLPAEASLRLLLEAGLPYEVRTTVHSSLLGEDQLRALADELRAAGVRRWVLQPYRAEGTRCERLPGASKPLGSELIQELRSGFEEFEIRE